MSYNHQNTYRSDPSFGLMPINTLETVDFSGRASVHVHGRPVGLDLLVQDVHVPLAEHKLTTENIGDTYSTTYFGKAPAVIQVSAIMPDYGNDDNFGKASLLNAYKNMLRITASAMTGDIPDIVVRGIKITGPWVGLTISENSGLEDCIVLNIRILAVKLEVSGKNRDGAVFDYASGAREGVDAFAVLKPNKRFDSVTYVATTAVGEAKAALSAESKKAVAEAASSQNKAAALKQAVEKLDDGWNAEISRLKTQYVSGSEAQKNDAESRLGSMGAGITQSMKSDREKQQALPGSYNKTGK